jgi:hypothetical protein
MKGTLFVIIGTPNSKRRSTLEKAVDSNGTKPYFLLPPELEMDGLLGENWQWDKKQFSSESIQSDKQNEWFLLLSHEIDLADQIEGVLELVNENEELNVGRIITFVNSELLKTNGINLRDWLDACAHFSDAMCFSNRQNDNAESISKSIDRFKDKCYPMETFIIGSKKSPPLNRILTTIPLRVSHILDPKDLLDPEDSAENDPFLAYQPNGKRIISILLPFK